MQLERKPRHVDQAFFLELFDSDRVDVAPGSNVIREDDQLDRLDCISHPLPSTVTGQARFRFPSLNQAVAQWA